MTTPIEQSAEDAASSPASPLSAEDQATLGGLAQLGRVVMTILACIALAYVVPGAERFRVWAPGDTPLFAGMFGTHRPTELPSFAGASGGAEPEEAARGRLAETLGESVASNLGSGDEARRPEGDTSPLTQIEASEYEGITQRIEDPTGRGMKPFYDALLRTAEREDAAITRIGHYGDSSIATDLITHTVRRRLQHRFGDAGHGFVLIARGHLPYRHRDLLHVTSGAWRVYEVTRQMLGDGRYGYGGIAVRGVVGARARFGTDAEAPVGQRVSRFDLYYQAHRRGGRVELTVDGEAPRVIDTASETAEDRVESVTVPDGPHELALRHMGGQVHLYGMVLERDTPGVVYDSLGLVGARANRLLNFDDAHIKAQLERRGTNLLVLGFGGNESSDAISEASYYEEFVQVIRRMRGERADLGCLVVAPLDQAERAGSGIRTLPAIPRIVAAQRRAARDEGCAFYDTWQAMGGSGAMRQWYRATPRLALSDFRHATPAGYEIIGNMLYKALLAGFDDYLEHRPRADNRPAR
jgi:lysophospholipase L1-like esterase